MAVPSIVRAERGDEDRCLATVGIAFVADPLIRWMFPEPATYLNTFGPLVRHFAGRSFEHNLAFRTDDFRAVALWLPPGASPDEESMGALLSEALPPERHGEVFGLLEQVGSSHPDQEHWYLPAIGVDPAKQGEGYGAALMATVLDLCDQAHAAAYLEASNPRGVPFYERLGFEVRGEIQSGTSPTIYPMLRSAR